MTYIILISASIIIVNHIDCFCLDKSKTLIAVAVANMIVTTHGPTHVDSLLQSYVPFECRLSMHGLWLVG